MFKIEDCFMLLDYKSPSNNIKHKNNKKNTLNNLYYYINGNEPSENYEITIKDFENSLSF